MRSKIFITFSLLILIPLLIIGAAVHQIFAVSKVEEVTSNTESSIRQLNNNLDLMIEDASRSTLSILYNTQLIQILKQHQSAEDKTYRNHDQQTAFSLFLSGMVYKKEQFNGVHVIANNGQVFSHMGETKVKGQINLQKQSWFRQVLERDGAWSIFPEDNPDYYLNESNKYISFMRLLKDPANHEMIGIVKVDFSAEYMDRLTSQLPSAHWQILQEGQPLFNNPMHDLVTVCGMGDGWIKNDVTKEQYLCMSDVSTKTGIEIKTTIPKSYIYKDVWNFDRLLGFIILVCLLVSLVLSYFVSNHLMRPLENFKTQILNLQKDKPTGKLGVSSHKDFAFLGDAYNDMLIEIQQLVEKVYVLNKKNAESEYKALQFRMDPHFIFNSLESINMAALQKREFEISDMVSELGKLIRYRLRSDNEFVLLKEELDFTKTYASIMQKRLAENLFVLWNIDEQVPSYQVPKYILQPLIENAILHGYENGKMTIIVDAVENAGRLYIQIQDNGSGISKERLAAIKETFVSLVSTKTDDGNSIALENIFQRIKLIYGDYGEMHIESDAGKGTTVTLIIPILEGGNYEKGHVG